MRWVAAAQRFGLSRDTAIITVALLLATYEIMIGNARPSALTFLAALFASPLAMHVDIVRRQNNDNGNGGGK